MRIFGKGFNFEQDGPGNRLVYHLSGCNMRCIWCSNPDGMDFSSGYEISVDDIIKECKSCVPMFFSGGGVTFTGGEATMQYKELLMILKRLKKEKINTALETNGTSEKLLEISEYIDYLIMDFKHFDNSLLKKYTGISNEIIKENYKKLILSGKDLHIRIPLINNINTQFPENFAKFFSDFPTHKVDFEFLPYHEYGKEKWKSEYLVKDGFITDEILRNFENTFKNYGLKIIKT